MLTSRIEVVVLYMLDAVTLWARSCVFVEFGDSLRGFVGWYTETRRLLTTESRIIGDSGLNRLL